MGIVLYWEMMSLYLKIDRKSPYSLKKGADLWEGKDTNIQSSVGEKKTHKKI